MRADKLNKRKNDNTEEEIKDFEAEPTFDRPIFATRFTRDAQKASRHITRRWTQTHSPDEWSTKLIRMNRPKLVYKSNHSLARRIVQAKLKKPNPQDHSHMSSQSSREDTDREIETDRLNITSLAKLQYQKDIGIKITTKKCNDRECLLHSRLICTNQVRSTITNRAYITRVSSANCNTSYVVYMIKCCRCGLQYVGQTGKTIRHRITRHLEALNEHSRKSALLDHFRKGECTGSHNMTDIKWTLPVYT